MKILGCGVGKKGFYKLVDFSNQLVFQIDMVSNFRQLDRLLAVDQKSNYIIESLSDFEIRFIGGINK